MSLTQIALKPAFIHFLDSLPPGVADSNREILEEMAIERFGSFYMIDVSSIIGREIESICVNQNDIPKELYSYFKALFEDFRDLYTEQDRPVEYQDVVEQLKKLTDGKCKENGVASILEYLENSFLDDVVLKEIELEFWGEKLIITKKASVLARIISESIQRER